ncbi:aspartyl/asparaginyl beta-hydroxylase domain-containing protein [Actinokineospora guangxiensis]|uniref:Aspartyl/asparaginyl beta-hydroxylase domain-containing protein n=1 Tax=Actinokineospora guangxiensis TaxID=1490288 RepID=A0ABW0ER75_9PSEU
MPGDRYGLLVLVKLLMGHRERHRTARLQDLATKALRDPRQAWVVSVVNLTIRARQALTTLFVLRPRSLRSRAARRHDPVTAPERGLTVLCPSRNRPAGMARLIRSVHRTAANPGRVEIRCYVDSDDPTVDAYRKVFASAARRYPDLAACELHVGEPIGVSAAWNVIAAAASGEFLVMANDDQLYVDHGWDRAFDARVAELAVEHPDEVLCLFFDGGQYTDDSADFPMISRAWYETLGYYSPGIFQQWQAEQWIFDIARRVGRLYRVPGVLVRHLHYQDYTAPFDATYIRHRLTADKSIADQALFLRTAGERRADADRLRAAIARRAGAERGRATADRNETRGRSEAVTTTNAKDYHDQALRRHYVAVIDAWNYSGRTDLARECAELAVSQGVWEHPLQRPREYLPGLTATPLHDPASFPFLARLESHHEDFRAEIAHVLDGKVDPVKHTVDDGGLIRTGAWKQAHLFRGGRWQDDVCAHFPTIREILETFPELTTDNPGVITVSRVTPGSHIMPHCGPTNALLRVHLPITVPPGVRIRVADQWLTWEEGRCLVFDDSFEHEVRHEGAEDRVVLILDTLHPELGGDHSGRLRERARATEEQMVSYLSENGLEEAHLREGRLVLYPDQELSDLALRHLARAGADRAELVDDRLRVHRGRGAGS